MRVSGPQHDLAFVAWRSQKFSVMSKSQKYTHRVVQFDFEVRWEENYVISQSENIQTLLEGQEDVQSVM